MVGLVASIVPWAPQQCKHCKEWKPITELVGLVDVVLVGWECRKDCK